MLELEATAELVPATFGTGKRNFTLSWETAVPELEATAELVPVMLELESAILPSSWRRWSWSWTAR